MRLNICGALVGAMVLAGGCGSNPSDSELDSDGMASDGTGGTATVGDSGGGGSSGDGTTGADDSGGDDGMAALPHRSCEEDEGLIQPIPDDAPEYIAAGFDRYVEIVAPNGKPIRIYAQPAVDSLAIYRAHNLLRFFLEDVAGSMYGADKDAVADAMANNGAVLVMPAGAHEEGNEPNVPAQPLYEDETPVDGSAWYIDNDFEHRDAALEEIFHLVHDTGIGTDFPGALPDYQQALLTEAQAALKDGRWGIPIDPGVSEWIEELAAEGSLAQEYIASVIDSYYGLWGPWDERTGGGQGMWGIYIAGTRDQVYSLDPAGAELLEQFLPAALDYEARLDPTFDGTFSMTFDAAQPYTHKSRYLVQVTLTGDANAGVMGNEFDNTLRGNLGDNRLVGGEGHDEVVYCHDQSEYTITVDGAEIEIAGPDGTDTLEEVESIAFADARVEVDSLRATDSVRH